MGFKPLVRGDDLVPSRDELKTFKRGISARDLGGWLGFIGKIFKKKHKQKEVKLNDQLAEDLTIEKSDVSD